MKQLLFFLLLLPAMVFGQNSARFADTLQKLLAARANAYHLHSAVAAVVFPDGSVWEGATGMCGSDPASARMMYEMGSNTKTFTSSIILELANEGKLNLDDTIYKYLPVNPNIAYGITIRQLLNHTSGIYDYTQHPDFFDFVNNYIDSTVEPSYMLDNWMDTMQFTPGSKWEYSNTNYLLLGLIIEKIENKPYDQVLHSRLLDSFRLKETFLIPQDNYSLVKAGTWLSDGSYFGTPFTSFMSAAWSAGAVNATPADLAKWAWMLYGGKVLPASWLDSMEITIPAGRGYWYGLGMFERKLGGRTYYGHGGTTLQNSEMDYSESSKFSCVTVVNEQDKGNQAAFIQNTLINAIEKLLPQWSGIEPNIKTEDTYKAYPVPCTGILHLQGLSGDYITLYSISGKTEVSVKMDHAEMDLPVENFPAGMYFLQISDMQGNAVYGQKIILQ